MGKKKKKPSATTDEEWGRGKKDERKRGETEKGVFRTGEGMFEEQRTESH